MRTRIMTVTAVLLTAALAAPTTARAKTFADEVGRVKVQPVQAGQTIQVPFITWGGDVATFLANGGLTTATGSIFQRQGLNLQLVNRDDFHQGVRDYLSGRTPFLRGTFRMIALAAEAASRDPRTQPVILFQLTYSAGDHLVSKADIKTIRDLQGKRIAIQRGGPHVGMLYDILDSAGMKLSDVRPVWTKGLSDPAAVLKKGQAEAAFAISPDMIGLTGGFGKTGTGAEGTVRGAHVLVSTAELSRSIADVYAVRKDWYDAHRDLAEKFTAGYLKGAEELLALKAKKGAAYDRVLKMAQAILGKKVLPTLDEADGLISDCRLVGQPGNIAFFQDKRNLRGFETYKANSLKMSVSWGFAHKAGDLLTSPLNWQSRSFVGYLAHTGKASGSRFNAEAVQKDIEALTQGGGLNDKVIYSFTVQFQPNQTDFSMAEYKADFDKVVKLAAMYGGAAIVARGHVDPTKTLVEMVRAGLAKGNLRRAGSGGSYEYYLNGRKLQLDQTKAVVKLIQSGAFDGVAQYNPKETMQAAVNLSLDRAKKAREAVIRYASQKGVKLNDSQLQYQGVGIREPLIPKPVNMTEAVKNMRVEFAVIKVNPEAIKSSDFDY